ncbi:MAG: DMT family transporter [Clostridia bacterium]|nr:DMT family transporter [Clostridia bacterium]
MSNTAAESLKKRGLRPLKHHTAIAAAILAAALYALNAPLSKLLLADVPPMMMAAFLYLGAGLGMFILSLARRASGHPSTEKHLSRRDLPYTLGMIVLDILAPIFLMIGLMRTTSANASLLNNFEIVATSLIALLIFKERISKRLWLAIGLIVLSSVLLTLEDTTSLQFSLGSVFVLLACICWGMENNCTRMLSSSDPQEIVVVKGLGSGTGAFIVALLSGEVLPLLSRIPMVLLLGFVAYGLSIYFYVRAQRSLGAARTSAYYAIAPFIGVLLSLVIFRQWPGMLFFAALGIMIAATVLVTKDQNETE